LILIVVVSLFWGCQGSTGDPEGAGNGTDPPGQNDPVPDDGATPNPIATLAGCPEPPQQPISDQWPEVFVGVEGCDDEGAGTRQEPFCSFAPAYAAVPSAPGIITVLPGEYRMDREYGGGGLSPSRPGRVDAYFVIRGEGNPVIYGSTRLAPGAWEDLGNGMYRVNASFLSADPTGMWTATGVRVIHVMETRDGRRSHAPVSALVAPGTWTKADAAGMGCGSTNAGCYIYATASDALSMDDAFEFSQGKFLFSVGSDYMTIRGLTIRYTQDSAISLEASDFVLVEENDFGHNANGDDNAYSIFLSYSQGGVIRHNRAFDSRYWGGTANSRGITVMSGGDETGPWICNNEVWDIIGSGITTKSGVSNAKVVGNYVHDVGTCVEIPSQRCHWQGCEGVPNGHTYPGGAWDVRENIFERCATGVQVMGNYGDESEALLPSSVYNNLFLDNQYGIQITAFTKDTLIRNNIFAGSGAGILYGNESGENRYADWHMARNNRSDFNFFATPVAIMEHPNWSGAAYYPVSLEDFVQTYGGEANSLSGDPMLDATDGYRPLPGSPVLNSGDASMYQADTANMGPHP
jgi:hypothetical protein